MVKKYKLGISTTIDYSIDINSILKLFSSFGFDFISLGADLDHSGYNESSQFHKVLETADRLSLFIESAHAPFRNGFNIASIDSSNREAAVDSILRFLDITSEYNIPLAIIHPHSYFDDNPETYLERIILSLEKIISAKTDNVKLVVENLPRSEDSWICSRILDQFNNSQLGFCFDSSHENMSGDSFHLLSKYYNRLTTCHLSDNHGQFDEHLVPGEGNINWDLLRTYFDKSSIENILFEVGTGEKLMVLVEKVIDLTVNRAHEIFFDNSAID